LAAIFCLGYRGAKVARANKYSTLKFPIFHCDVIQLIYKGRFQTLLSIQSDGFPLHNGIYLQAKIRSILWKS